MRALALDVGSRTIGLARSAEGDIATAWETLTRSGHQADAAEIVRRVRDGQAEHVVVGLPLELDGRHGHRARLVDRFVEVLRDALSEAALEVEIHAWDERFSTAAAERTMLEADASRRQRKAKVDAVAAQFILQGWLDARARAAAGAGA